MKKPLPSPKQYTAAALAKRHRLRLADARAVLQKAGWSRERADELAAAEKQAELRWRDAWRRD